MRMFVAVRPPDEATEHLDEFLEPRREHGSFRWTSPDQLHLTLAFLEQVPDRALDALVEGLQRGAARRTPFAARIMNRIDARWAATVALLAFALSFFMRSGYTPDADFRAFVMPMLVQGVAMSTFFISMVTLCLNGVPQHQVPAASGLTNFARITAGSFAASIATTVWDRSEALHQTRLSETVASTDPAWLAAIGKLHAAGLSLPQAAGAVTNQFVNQAYLLASVDFFRVSAWLIVAMIPLIWLTRKAMSGGGAHAAAD